mgnify:CR=1 FL=1
MATQQEYFALHRFLFVNNIRMQEVINVAELKIEMPTTDVATDDNWIIPVRTGMKKVSAIEVALNNPKGVNDYTLALLDWRNQNKSFPCYFLDTDERADADNPDCWVKKYDMGNCKVADNIYPDYDKMSPKGSTIKFTLLVTRLDPEILHGGNVLRSFG